ncbi:MAG TPA: hypothetical protein VHR72_03620 [Gemmataceae bacterium]|jgi:hypothetical protein|nr:hypothetical protein [Gemmataceae bacterium]
MRAILSLMVLAPLLSVASAQDPVPAGAAPKFGLASASEKEGKVRIDVFEMREVIRVKMPNAGDVFLEQRHWLPLTTGTLGKDIRAYRPDGKQATPDEVLKALPKRRGVAYFLGFNKNQPIQPDSFFLGLLKEGSVALAFDRPELAVQQP